MNISNIPFEMKFKKEKKIDKFDGFADDFQIVVEFLEHQHLNERIWINWTRWNRAVERVEAEHIRAGAGRKSIWVRSTAAGWIARHWIISRQFRRLAGEPRSAAAASGRGHFCWMSWGSLGLDHSRLSKYSKFFSSLHSHRVDLYVPRGHDDLSLITWSIASLFGLPPSLPPFLPSFLSWASNC